VVLDFVLTWFNVAVLKVCGGVWFNFLWGLWLWPICFVVLCNVVDFYDIAIWWFWEILER